MRLPGIVSVIVLISVVEQGEITWNCICNCSDFSGRIRGHYLGCICNCSNFSGRTRGDNLGLYLIVLISV